MYRPVNCGLCGTFLGNYHGHESRAVITRHFKREHPKELAELKLAREALSALKEKYAYRGIL